MVFALILIAVGIIKKQPRSYWISVGWAVLIQFACQYLFHMDTGLVTPWVKKITGDGPMMAAYGILVIVLAWVLPLFLVRRGYRRGAVPVPPPTLPDSN